MILSFAIIPSKLAFEDGRIISYCERKARKGSEEEHTVMSLCQGFGGLERKGASRLLQKERALG